MSTANCEFSGYMSRKDARKMLMIFEDPVLLTSLQGFGEGPQVEAVAVHMVWELIWILGSCNRRSLRHVIARVGRRVCIGVQKLGFVYKYWGGVVL
jgi:hypothetical protein